MAGRPKALDAEAKGKILAYIQTGASQAEAGRYLGVSSETIRAEKHRDAAFKAAFQQARQDQWESVQSAMFAKAADGNVQAAKLWKEMFLAEEETPVNEEEDVEQARKAAIDASLPDRQAVEE